jgi:hypothetical protein
MAFDLELGTFVLLDQKAKIKISESEELSTSRSADQQAPKERKSNEKDATRKMADSETYSP